MTLDEAYVDAVRTATGGKQPHELGQRRFRDPPRDLVYAEGRPSEAAGPGSGLGPAPAQIRVPIQVSSPTEAVKLALQELEKGAEGILYVLDPRLRGHDHVWNQGVEVHTVRDFEQLLDGILVDLAPVALESGVSWVPAGGALLRAFQHLKTDPSRVQGQLGADPLGTWARLGALSADRGRLNQSFASLMRTSRSLFPKLRVGRVDGTVWTDAGAGTVSELTGILANLAELFRMLEAEGVDLSTVPAGLEIRVAMHPDPLETVIKVRALRWALRSMWAHLKLSEEIPTLEGIPDRTWLTRRDIHTNLVRLTSMAAGGAMAGLDAVVALPYDATLDSGDGKGRRLARNLHYILREESRLHEVRDPARGSAFVETQTMRTAEAAFERFVELERSGGLGAALEAGSFQASLAKERDAQLQAVRTRKRVLVGISQFVDLKEDPASDTRFEDSTHIVEGPAWARLEVQNLEDLTPDGPLWSMNDAERHASIPKLTPVRWAEPFERLRDRSDRWLVEHGQRPRVRLERISELSRVGPRFSWTQGLLEAGGMEVSHHAEPVAVLVGTDADLETEGTAAAARLRAEGARWVAVAGPDHGGPYDGSIRLGDDVVEFLHQLWVVLDETRGER